MNINVDASLTLHVMFPLSAIMNAVTGLALGAILLLSLTSVIAQNK